MKTQPGGLVSVGVGAGDGSKKSTDGEYGTRDGCGVRIRRLRKSSSVGGYKRSDMKAHFLVRGSEPTRGNQNLISA